MTTSPEPASPGRDARLPDFFIVGHAKCGTTALYEMLREHTQIFMPDNKEPWYFAADKPRPRSLTDHRTTFDQTGVRAETLEEYLGLFADAAPGQLLGEASTSYLWSVCAPQRIAQMRPDARIIAILREPASFVRSMHLQLVQNRVESERDLRRALELEGPRRRGEEIPKYSNWPRTLMYSDRVRYVEQLRRYEAVFPPEQILVLIYDDFRADNEGTVRRVLRFLGVDDTEPIAVKDANPTVRVRSERVRGIVRSVNRGETPVARVVRSTGKVVVPTTLRRNMRRLIVYGKPPPVDEVLMRELRSRFKPEVIAAGEHLGRDLVGLWGYDRI